MKPTDVTIRILSQDEVPQWWEMRLRALKEHPEAFGSDYETSRQGGYGHVVERNFGLDRGMNAIFVAVDSQGQMLSTAGVFGDTGKRSHIAYIVGVYTIPEARVLGLARCVVTAAIDRCRTFPQIRQALISVNADNASALHLYESLGFVAWGREPRAIALPDRFDDEIHLALMLDENRETAL
ncbi:MAG TPA: GNAT family N-acetyltransferase [Thermomicrobiales bacterium]|nr:GNAT family N-acetyltransferase [Thermomicrobiales bacterium]